MNREKTIIRTSIIGILANVLLAAFKAFIGIAANSVSVISDAVNNISDAASSVITIAGTKLAGKAPDKKHPLGYGRIEYITAMVVAAIVLYAGITTLVDSIKKIIHPEQAEYSIISLVILAAAVGVKLILGAYTKKKGREVKSGSLTASGQDAFQDAILSASVLATALIFIFTGVSLEAWVGAVISVFIIKSGLEMIVDAVNEILGKRPGGEVTKAMKETIARNPEVRGAYDLLLNNYGPDLYIGSVHIEVPEDMTAREIDALSRKLQEDVYREHGILLGTIGVYSVNTKGGEIAQAYEDIRKRVTAREGVLQIHGFYMDTEKKTMRFDLILDFAVRDRKALYRQICEEIAAAYPEYTVHIALDVDLSD